MIVKRINTLATIDNMLVSIGVSDVFIVGLFSNVDSIGGRSN